MEEKKGKHIINIERIARYEIFIFIGILIALGSLFKLLGKYDFSSDWFWFIAGLGLVVEGAIAFSKQKKFDKKYKVILRE